MDATIDPPFGHNVSKIPMEPTLRGPPTFDTLPNEMIASIVGFADTQDLPALRLACKLAGSPATNRFARFHFRRLNIFMSEQGLESLMKICSHPDFGPAVKTVALSAFRLLEQSLDVCAYEYLAGMDPAARQRARNRTREHALRLDEQDMLRGTGRAQDGFTQAFRILESYGSKISISVHDGSALDRSLPCHGSNDFFGQDLSHDHGEYCRDKALKLLLNAAFRSGCEISSVHISITGQIFDHFVSEKSDSGEFDLSGQPSGNLDDDAAPTIFGRLQHLSIEKRPDNSDDSPFLSSKTIESIDYILSLSPHLQTVDITLDREPHLKHLVGDDEDRLYNAMDKFAESLKSDNLHTLNLYHLVGHVSPFIDLLDKHKNTLRVIALDGCVLRSGGLWSHLLQWMLDNLALQEFVIENAQVESDPLTDDLATEIVLQFMRMASTAEEY